VSARIRAPDAGLERFRPAALDDRVSIGMSAHGNPVTTRQALQCLLYSAAGDYELILVDDCSPDGGETLAVFEQAQREHADTKVFAFDRNLEYSGSLNAILSHARGEAVIFLSNDVFATPDYLRGLVAAARADERLGIVRGCSNFVDNSLPAHNVALEAAPRTLADVFEIGAEVARMHGGALLADEFLTGDAFLVTRAVLERIGTLDPLFFGYYADHDFGLRARIAGFAPALARGAFAFHHRDANLDYLSEEARDAKLRRRWARVYENWARFKLKYGLPAELELPPPKALPWADLAAGPFDPRRHFFAPADYGRYLHAARDVAAQPA
jgi:GT2 family glycosyltransferase